jgi:triacylglycerol esterase/lipase EstA (alpha/beta hydrolase family)
VLVLLALVVLAAVVAIAVVAVRQARGETVADQARPGPVVLVPGYGGAVSDLDPLVAEVRREGRTAVVFRPSGDGTGDLRTQAKRLAELVDRTLEAQGAKSIDLVGYSAGGVIARLYVRDEGGASVVRRVLTIGSPQHGTTSPSSRRTRSVRAPLPASSSPPTARWSGGSTPATRHPTVRGG